MVFQHSQLFSTKMYEDVLMANSKESGKSRKFQGLPEETEKKNHSQP